MVKDSKKTKEQKEKEKKAKEEKAKKEKEKKEKEKKEREEEEMRNLKPNYKVEDQLKGDMQHKPYEDVVSRPNNHIPWGNPPKQPSADDDGGEAKNEIFEKSEATIKIKSFVHEFEKEGINPLVDLLHINYKVDVTELIKKRFELSEQLNRDVLHLYLKADKEVVTQFNEELEDLKVDDFDTVDEKLKEVKELRKVQKELVKIGDDPLKLTEVTQQISKLEQQVMAAEAQRKVADKVAAIKRRKRKSQDSDLNYEKYPDHHDHMDLYFNDSFNGIQHHFKSIFGS